MQFLPIDKNFVNSRVTFQAVQPMVSNCEASMSPKLRRDMGHPAKFFYAASSTDKIFPAGSLNHAMVGPLPREIPRASVFRFGSL